MSVETINSLPLNDAAFLTTLTTFLREEDVDRRRDTLSPFVITGGTAPTSVSLSHTITALTAFVDGYYVNQGATAHTYSANKRTFVYAHRDTATPASFTITGGDGATFVSPRQSHLVFVEANVGSWEPDRQDGLMPLMAVDTNGTAITTVTDLRAREPLPAQLSIDSYANLATAIAAGLTKIILNRRLIEGTTQDIPIGVALEFVDKGFLEVTTGKIVTIRGPLKAVKRRVFGGTGKVVLDDFAVAERVNTSWFGTVPDYGSGNTNNAPFLQAAFDAVELSGGAVVYTPPGGYRLTATVYQRGPNVVFEGGGINTTVFLHDSDYGHTLVCSLAILGVDHLPGIFIKNMRFYTTLNTSSGAHLVFQDCILGGIENVSADQQFRGFEMYGCGNFHAKNFFILSGLYFSTLKVGSFYGLIEVGSHPTQPQTTEVQFDGFDFHGNVTESNVEHGLIVSNAAAIRFTNGHVGWATAAALLIFRHASATQLYGTFWDNVWFDGAHGGTPIQFQSGTFGTSTHKFTNCVIEQNPAAQGRGGVFINEPSGAEFVNCTWVGMTSHCLQTADNVLVNSVFVNGGTMLLQGNGSQTQFGVLIGYRAQHIKVQNVSIIATNALFNANLFGVAVNGNTVNPSVDIHVSGNSFQNILASNAIVDPNTAAEVGSRRYQNNITDPPVVTVASADPLALPSTGDVFFISGTTNFSSIRHSWQGRRVTLIFQGVLSMFASGTLLLNSTFTTTANDTITLVCTGTNWYEVQRSVN